MILGVKQQTPFTENIFNSSGKEDNL